MIIKKSDIPLYLSFSLCFIALYFYLLMPEKSWDVFWHLKMGLDYIEKDQSLFIDYYSFTNYGDAISSVPVFFQLSLAYMVSFFGEKNGFILYKISYIVVALTVLAAYLKQIKAPIIVSVLIIPLISYFIAHRIILRPELISNVFLLLSLLLYVRVRREFNWQGLLAISLLILLWVNYHSPVLGYVVVFGLFVDRFIHKLFLSDKTFSWLFYFSWASVIFLIGFINVSGQHFVFQMIDFVVNNKGATTLEYLPARHFYAFNSMVHLAWMLSICVIIWSIAIKQYGMAVISLIVMYFSWTTSRVVTPAALVNVCFLAYLLSDYYNNNEQYKLKSIIRKKLAFSIIVLAIFTYYKLSDFSIRGYETAKNWQVEMDVYYPRTVTNYLKKHQQGGKIFNQMNLGGYLINSLSPEFKVYLDGRTNILYPLARIPEHMKLMRNREKMKAEIIKYDIDYILLENRYWLTSLLYGVKGVQLNYVDESYILFSKENVTNAFPVSSLMYLAPSCWQESMAESLQKELLLANEISLSESSKSVKGVSIFYNEYILAANKEVFLKTKLSEKNVSQHIVRIISYLALKNKLYELAEHGFTNIKYKQGHEYLVLAYVLMKLEKYDYAERTLLAYTGQRVFYFMPDGDEVGILKRITPVMTSILLSLIDEMSNKDTLKYFKGSDFDELVDAHLRYSNESGFKADLNQLSMDVCRDVTHYRDEDTLGKYK